MFLLFVQRMSTGTLGSPNLAACSWHNSYFNNELSEEAKKLIGDIAPKKIEVKVS